MLRQLLILVFFFLSFRYYSQLAVARDTLSVIENGYVLKMPWANGLNYLNVSPLEVNFDNKKDIVVFDRSGTFGGGRFRCFINNGNSGEVNYTSAPDLSYAFPNVRDWAVFRDYNCDGKEDLFCSTPYGIKVYQNTSSPTQGLNFTLAKELLESDYDLATPIYLANLYASSIGMPGISDIDNDGDLDILTFSAQGTLIEYHRNISKEKYGHCDSLVFELGQYCWGNISESSCGVGFNACSSSKPMLLTQNGVSKPYHAGSCLTCLDSDGDGDKDLIMGDVFCNTLQYAHNSGTTLTAVFSDTTKLYPNYPNKNSTTQVKINNFPCAYHIDVNNDSKIDLVASPNAPNGENTKSCWLYKNTSSTNTVNFEFVKNNFLQDEMIEVGQNSFPVLFDYNADGKKDLLIGTFGYYENFSFSTKLTLYQNMGTTTQPSYSLITRDYASMSSKNLNGLMPTVGDIDGDGDVDIIIGTSTGQIHWLENTAGAGNVCNFSNFKNNPFTFTTTSGVAAPQAFDLDSDGKLDLIIGTKNGKISFYKNTGTISQPSFSLVTNTLGNVNVNDTPSSYGIDGYATPFLYREGTTLKLLVGSVSGKIFQYSVPSNVTANYNLITNALNGYNEGEQSSVWLEDINNDAKPDLFIGNTSGGLSFFSSTSPYVGINNDFVFENNNFVALFPNPADNQLTITVNETTNAEKTIVIFNVLGKTLQEQTFTISNQTIDIKGLEPGVYFLKVNFLKNAVMYSETKKFVKQR